MTSKKAKEQKRNLMYLISHFLKEEGYLESAECLEAEAQLSSQYSICDNIDLATILQEYETYYYLKFQKQPKICKLAPKSESAKETSKSAQKPKNSAQRSKRPSLEEPKQDDIADLMNIQSLQNKEETAESVPAFKEAASVPFSKEMHEMSENISREIVSATFDVKWDDVIGLKKAKQTLEETLSLPLQYPGLFQGILAPWKSVLLYGPPGTGKTMIAKALASESKMTFFNITATSVVSKWRGDSEKLMRVLFETAKRQAPAVIFMDEFEALACRSADDHEGNRRLRAEFLMQMDGLSSSTTENVFLLAITNSPWSLQSSILRRFEKRIFIDLPNASERKEIVEKLLPVSGYQHLEFVVDYGEIAQMTTGYSGSDLKTMCREAAMSVVRDSLAARDGCALKNGKLAKLRVDMDDVERAISRTKPTASSIQNKYYEWEKAFGSS